MRHAFRAAALLLTLGSGPAFAAGGHVLGSVGSRELDEDDWAPVESQPMIGALASFQVGGPFHIAAGVQASSKEEDSCSGGICADFTGTVVDLSLGLQVMGTSGLFRPYLGAGVVSTSVEFEADGPTFDASDDDTSIGWYAGGGGVFRIGQHFEVGADLRWVGGTEIELFGAEGDVDSLVASVTVGFGWE